MISRLEGKDFSNPQANKDKNRSNVDGNLYEQRATSHRRLIDATSLQGEHFYYIYGTQIKIAGAVANFCRRIYRALSA